MQELFSRIFSRRSTHRLNQVKMGPAGKPGLHMPAGTATADGSRRTAPVTGTTATGR